jgi:hypothetical protein
VLAATSRGETVGQRPQERDDGGLFRPRQSQSARHRPGRLLGLGRRWRWVQVGSALAPSLPERLNALPDL